MPEAEEALTILESKLGECPDPIANRWERRKPFEDQDLCSLPYRKIMRISPKYMKSAALTESELRTDSTIPDWFLEKALRNLGGTRI